jgi:hypothetical protein
MICQCFRRDHIHWTVGWLACVVDLFSLDDVHGIKVFDSSGLAQRNMGFIDHFSSFPAFGP